MVEKKTEITVLELRSLVAFMIAGENFRGGTMQEYWGLVHTARRVLSELGEPALRLILNERLYVTIKDGEPKFLIRCPALFFDGFIEDVQPVKLHEIPEIVKAVAETRRFGEFLWTSRVRGMRPRKVFYEYMTNWEKDLFDATGPPRLGTERKVKLSLIVKKKK